MQIKRTRHVVRLKNGRFVEEWQYSQGHFDVVEADSIFEACEITQHSYDTFFHDLGDYLTVELTATISE